MAPGPLGHGVRAEVDHVELPLSFLRGSIRTIVISEGGSAVRFEDSRARVCVWSRMHSSTLREKWGVVDVLRASETEPGQGGPEKLDVFLVT